MLLLTEATRSGVEEYEQIEVDETTGPGPQDVSFFFPCLFVKLCDKGEV